MKKKRRDIYQEVTNKILECLEEGTVPWRNPIASKKGDGWPKNLASGNRYRGINVFLLAMQSWARGFTSDYWLTFKQAKAKGGTIRKGEKGALVTFWKLHQLDATEKEDVKTVPVLRHYTVFNVQQADCVEVPDISDTPPLEFEPIEKADMIVAGYQDPPLISHDGGHRAYYRCQQDSVHMPKPDAFESKESYYATLFHELSHSTGIKKRLGRGLDTNPAAFGSPDYSTEELVAELSSAFLCASCGISPPTIEQSAAYIQGWIDVLKGDKRLAITAAGAAQKSADYILGQTSSQVEENTSSNANATHSQPPNFPNAPARKLT